MYFLNYNDKAHCEIGEMTLHTLTSPSYSASVQEAETELNALRQQSETTLKALTSEKQTLQEKLTKMSFENSSMKEQLKEATNMVRSAIYIIWPTWDRKSWKS